MKYTSAIDSIKCILKDCDPNTQIRIINESLTSQNNLAPRRSTKMYIPTVEEGSAMFIKRYKIKIIGTDENK
jgi:hypothetical protein